MAIRTWCRLGWIASCASLLLIAPPGIAEQIRVKHVQGALHAFLVLRTEEGKAIAVGDLDQTVEGSRVTVTQTFHFDDGSLHEDTAVYSQRGAFRVLSDHLLEKGPAFKKSVEVWINCSTGEVKVREMKEGKDDVKTYHVDIPADLANGILPVLMQNLPDNSQRTFSILAASPKPRIAKLVVKPEGEETFQIEGTKFTAKQYVAKIDLGGVAGAVAPAVGKQPPDAHIWMSKGKVPVFLKMTGPLSENTPVWQIEVVSPSWGRSKK